MLMIELSVQEAAYLQDLLASTPIPAGKASIHATLEKKIQDPYVTERFVRGIQSGQVQLAGVQPAPAASMPLPPVAEVPFSDPTDPTLQDPPPPAVQELHSAVGKKRPQRPAPVVASPLPPA